MKRVLLIILLHLSLFFLVFAYQAQAEEENEWYVNDFGTFVVAAVSGEVIHGDKLRFFIKITQHYCIVNLFLCIHA